MFRIQRLVFTAVVLMLAAATSSHAAPQWIEQLGTDQNDYSFGVSADSLGNVYISGRTWGSLGGPNAGFDDAFLAKYDAAGTLLWTEQLGTVSLDRSEGVSADSLGNVYISGTTLGSLGGPSAGSSDAFLAKYDAAGTLQWTEQLGTNDRDESFGVSADSLGNVFISGRTQSADAFVAKYDSAGTLLWTEQLGTSRYEESLAVSADSLGNVYISGYTSGSLGGPNAGGYDAFVAKYDTAGTLMWIEQLGTSTVDRSHGVSADSFGNVYITGYTAGKLGETDTGSGDAFLAKYGADGTLLWTEQLGPISYEESFGVSADSLGNVYISGNTFGSLGGPNAGFYDAFLAKYDAAGTLLWTEQLGTADSDYSRGVSADSLGNVFISGYTSGSLGGPNAGGYDAFLAKYVPIPGDGNDDRKVDGLDYLIWAGAFGDDPALDPPGSPANGDYNDDGVVDGLDYMVWASNYGQGLNDAAAVPEPGTSSLLLGAMAIVGLLMRRRS